MNVVFSTIHVHFLSIGCFEGTGCGMSVVSAYSSVWLLILVEVSAIGMIIIAFAESLT